MLIDEKDLLINAIDDKIPNKATKAWHKSTPMALIIIVV